MSAASSRRRTCKTLRLNRDPAAYQRRLEQHGGPRRRARGAGSTRILLPAEAVLITIVYPRQVGSQKVLGELLGMSDMAIGLLISETRQLLR